ncbi:MAG: hypothetical protein L6R40_000961 [Gallowayella cf. fulva]|nr:MAG: hypothetical protein L6R40_000961 [Xanthomendoza cf. fulva]
MEVNMSSEGPHAALIVTFFAKARPSNAASIAVTPGQDDFRSQSLACGSTFSQLLAYQVAPAESTLHSFRTLTPGVFQSVYAMSSPFPKPDKLRHHASVIAFEALHALEIVFDLLPAAPFSPLRPVRLAVFDMDSTLINEEVIDELARSIGITSAVSAITARAMNGEIEFEQSLRQRLALLQGVKADVWEELKETVTVAAGAKELVGYLRERGVITVVVSGGFAPMADWLKESLGLDHAFANHLVVSPSTATYPYSHLTGELSPEHPIVVPEYKRHVLTSLAHEHSIPLSETLVVGDGSNDLLMLGAAGLGIAWRAKERVQREAPQRLNGTSLSDLILLLGNPESGNAS